MLAKVAGSVARRGPRSGIPAALVRIDVEIGHAPEMMRGALETPRGKALLMVGPRPIGQAYSRAKDDSLAEHRLGSIDDGYAKLDRKRAQGAPFTVRYHGVFGPASRWRSEIVPGPPIAPSCSTSPDEFTGRQVRPLTCPSFSCRAVDPACPPRANALNSACEALRSTRAATGSATLLTVRCAGSELTKHKAVKPDRTQLAA